MASASDKRQHPRYDVHIHIVCATAETVVSAYAANISLGGVFVRTDTPLPADSEVALSVELSQAHPMIQTRGRVVWMRAAAGEDGVGPGLAGMAIAFEFLSLSPGDQALLGAYLQRLAANPPR